MQMGQERMENSVNYGTMLMGLDKCHGRNMLWRESGASHHMASQIDWQYDIVEDSEKRVLIRSNAVPKDTHEGKMGLLETKGTGTAESYFTLKIVCC